MEDRSPRILITRLSHIGDCVLTLPVLCALRSKFPSAFIAWAVEKPTNQLLELHPDLDRLILVPRGWLGKPKQILAIRRELRSHQFDISIDPQGLTKSSMLGWLSGARRRIGLKGDWGRELSKWLNNELVATTAPHIVDRSLELLQVLDIHQPQVRFDLPVDPACGQWVNSFLQARQVNRPFAIINPGASWKSKRWNDSGFAAVANYMKQRYGMTSVIAWAGQEELQMAQAVAAIANRTATSDAEKNSTVLAPRSSLRQFAALCDAAHLLIGGDTGPLHIAGVMGARCIGLYGTTRPTDSGAYGPQHVAVQKWYQGGTSRERRSAENLAMRDILPEDVCAAVDQILS